MYKRQRIYTDACTGTAPLDESADMLAHLDRTVPKRQPWVCLLYTSDAADERSSVDLGGRRIIKKKKKTWNTAARGEITGKLDDYSRENNNTRTTQDSRR